MQNGKSDEDSRKLFLGGLPPEATKEDLQAYFGKYGEIEMVTIKTDVFTGRSRGFGFLIFKDVSSVTSVLGEPSPHQIMKKTVEAKLATPQEKKGEGDRSPSTKVFVGGIDRDTDKDTITNEFSKRGKVVDVYMPVDKMTNQAKGFAFVNFDESSIAATLCEEGKIVIDGKECDIKPAKEKNESRGRGGFQGGRGSFQGGRGGGRGGFGGYGGYDQYNSGYNQYNDYSASGYGGYGNSGGYGGDGYGGNSYDQYGGGYGQSGYGGANYGGGYDQSSGFNSYGQDQYKMKGNRGGRGGYTPY